MTIAQQQHRERHNRQAPGDSDRLSSTRKASNSDESNHFDIVVIGGGPGGYATALRASELGLTVALVERNERLGGVCLNRGCIPSKALIEATRTVATIHDASRMGVNASIDSIDASRLRDFKDHMVTSMTDGLQSLIDARNVTVFHGKGTLAEDHTVTVDPTSASAGTGDTTESTRTSLHADNVVLATGSTPRPLPGIPFGGRLIDSTQALDLLPFPKSAIIIGAGAIAVEFASMWRAAGVDVTLLIRKDRVLSGWHRRTGVALTRALRRSGVNVVAHTGVTGVETIHQGEGDDNSDRHAVVSFTDRNGETHTAMADVALGAIGRVPTTSRSWSETAGVKIDDDGLVATDTYGHTTAEGIWALGDITAGPNLAYRAYEQGMVIAESIAGLDPRPVDDTTVPQVVFSTPEAASVGLTLEEAKADGDIVEPKETVYPVMGNARMQMSGMSGSLSLVTGTHAADPGQPVVLGVHMLAPEASDLIAEAAQLVASRVPLSQAARRIAPHPTFSEMMGEALLKADDRPLNTR